MRLTERPLFYWVTHRYRGLQLILLLAIVIGLFFRVYPLEMQRRIINIAINLRMIDKLYLYCALYLGAVLIAVLLKYFTNTFQAIIGQKILIGMRQEIYQHILQLPLSFFHRTQAGTIVSAMTAELNAIGQFLGGAIAVPITAVLTFATFVGFMIYLNPLLGLLSMVIYPFEFAVIPLLQNWYNRYNRKRVQTTRQMSSLVNESVSGIHEVQGNASFRLEQKKLDRLISRLYQIMTKLYIFKYGVKFSNSLFQSFGPFLLFLIGGYLAIHGEFTIGALVAFLSAYEKVYDPWKEVIEYYQGFQDARIRYYQIMELFDYEPDFLLQAPDRAPQFLSGDIVASNVCYQVNDTIQLLNDVSFELPAGKHLALVGFSGSGKSTLSLLISQLYKCSSGSLTIDGCEVDDLSKIEVASNISTVAQHPFIFTGSVRENLLYSSNALYLNEVRERLPDRGELIEVITEVGLEEDVLRWGLRSKIPPKRAEALIPSFLRMRRIILDELREEFSEAVEFYDARLFLYHAPLAINIMFGIYGLAYTTEKLLHNKQFRNFLMEMGLESQLVDLGYGIAESTIDFLGDFRGDSFFFQGSPMEQGQFQMFEDLVKRARRRNGVHGMKGAEKDQFLLLALEFTPAEHKIATITETLEQEILAARKEFLAKVASIDLEECTNGAIQTTIAPYKPTQASPKDQPTFTPFCISHYFPSYTLRDNIIFGTVIDREQLRGRLGIMALEEFEHHGLLDDIMDIGLDFHVGSKGDNLSGGQKQKIALARALLKRSGILVLDEATASLDNKSQARVHEYIQTKLKGNTTVVAVVHRLDMISEYDHILVMKEGQIVESGNYDELISKKGTLYELVNKT